MKFKALLIAILVTAFALSVAAGTVWLCSFAVNAQPLIVESKSSPTVTVDAYFTHLSSGDFEAANGLLIDEVITFAEDPDSEIGSMLFHALWDHFSCTVAEPAAVEGLTATQKVSVTYLDIPSLTSRQRIYMRAALEQLAREYDQPDLLLNEDGYYNAEIGLSALRNVTAQLLEDPSPYLVTTELTLNLEYINYEWKIHANEELYTVLSGNTVRRG